MNHNEMKVPELKKLANRELGLKYSQLDKMKKAEIIQSFLDSQEPTEPTEPTESVELTPREILNRDVQNFLSKGGKVTQAKSQPDGIREAPTEKSAEKNLHRGPKKSTAKPSLNKGDKVDKPKKAKKPRIREQDDIVTLQSLIEEAGITGTQARKKLRTSGIPKPGKQWVWEKGDKQIAKVTKLLAGK